jgi:hypothetical protein
MAIKLPHSNQKQARASAPNTPVGSGRKPARLRRFSPSSLGQPWPGHWPGQPGPNFAEQEPFPCLPGKAQRPARRSLGEPLSIRQVAYLLGCSPWTVRQTLIPRGLPHFRFKASGRLTFFEGQVIRWIENQQQGGETTE